MLLIFDVGGVLRDSSLAIHESMKRAFEKAGLPFPFSPWEVWHLRGLCSFHSGRDAIRILLSSLKEKANLSGILERPDADFYLRTYFKDYHDPRLVEEIYSEYKKHFNSEEMKTKISLIPNTESSLRKLKKKHTLAVFSNTSMKTIERDIPFLDLFDHILSGDNIPKKPSGYGIRKIMEDLDFSEKETVYIGDSCVDILAARDAGVISAVLLTGMGLEHHLRNLFPDMVFENISQLTNHFLEMDIHKTVAIVIHENNRFLLIKRGKDPWKGFWAVPGGHVEDEGTYEAAVREAKEEIGDAEILKKLFVLTHDVGIGHKHECYVYLGRLKEPPRAGGDAEEVNWFSLNELKSLKLSPVTIQIINRLLYGVNQ